MTLQKRMVKAQCLSPHSVTNVLLGKLVYALQLGIEQEFKGKRKEQHYEATKDNSTNDATYWIEQL